MSARLAIVLMLFLCGCRQAPQQPVKQYALHGEVLRLDSKDKIAAIKHESIGDWMPAMTMEFPVKDPKDFDSLKPGERIHATVYVQGDNFWVGQVREDQSK